jgi:hypothetical protein
MTTAFPCCCCRSICFRPPSKEEIIQAVVQRAEAGAHGRLVMDDLSLGQENVRGHHHQQWQQQQQQQQQ